MSNDLLFQQGYALVIGVGADLPVTISDALGIKEILLDQRRCAYPNDHVICLTEKQATKQNILSSLDVLAKQAGQKPDSTVIIYFSGHGGYDNQENYYLVPFGYQSNDISSTAILETELTAKLKSIPAKKLLVLLDCCHAGGMTKIEKEKHIKASSMPINLANMLISGSGRVLIASSRKDEVSWTGKPYSVFTQALREGLAGYGASEQDGYAYVADVAMYLGRVVPNRTNNSQHPILKLSKADNFVISYYAGSAKNPTLLSGSESSPIQMTTIDVDMLVHYQRLLKKYKENLFVVEEKMSVFYDYAAIPPDLERAKEGIVAKISEIEEKIKLAAS
jgi:hypothetical protein